MHERRSRLPGSEPAEAASLSLGRRIQEQAQRTGSDLLGLLFPSRCAGCQRVDEVLCAACRAAFVPLSPPWCSSCGQPVAEEGALCERCQRHRPPYVAGHSVFQFEGTLRKAVHALKYERRAEIGGSLVDEMLNTLPRQWPDYQAWPLDAAVAVPLHPAREAARGYNQARLLAEPLAKAWGIDVLDDAVRRVRDTQPQMSLNARERQENVRAAFLGEAAQVSGLDLLLVDDVRTTGATLAACALALAEAGAKSVRVLALANAVGSGIPLMKGGPDGHLD